MATKKKNADVQTLDNVDDDVMNESNEEIEGTGTGENTEGENNDTNGDDGNTEAPQNPEDGSTDGANDGENDGDDGDGDNGDDAPIVPMDDDNDGDGNDGDGDDGDGDDGDEDDDTEYAENFKIKDEETSHPVRDVKAQNEIAALKARNTELEDEITQLNSALSELNDRAGNLALLSGNTSITIDGNGTATGTLEISLPDNYKSVFIIETWANTGNCFIYNHYGSADGNIMTVNMSCRNFNSSSLTCNIYTMLLIL